MRWGTLYQLFSCSILRSTSVSELIAKLYKVELTGLTQRFLSRFPSFKEVAPDFLNFIQGSDLILHASSNDILFLSRELEQSGLHYNIKENHQIIDTLDIAKLLFPNKRNSLNALNERLNINQHRTKHGALLDAEITAEAYLSMLSLGTFGKYK